MIFPRMESEHGWSEDYLRTPESEDAIQLRESHVIAYRDSDRDAIDVRYDDLITQYVDRMS